MWFDSHCHLTAGEFDPDREQVLERAREAGVETLIAIGSGYGIDHNRLATELAAQDARVFATVGVHPHEAKDLDAGGRGRLREWLTRPRVLAVGECGLDYHYLHSERSVQREVFAEQVAWAREFALPASIHVRGDDPNAFDEMLDIWCSEGGGAVSGVLHCYTGSLDFARKALDAGLFISFSGILTFKQDRGLRETARALPLDRLLVETDAPLLAPEGFRGRRNEPARVGLVGQTLAQVHKLPLEVVARATTGNARRLFRTAEHGDGR